MRAMRESEGREKIKETNNETNVGVIERTENERAHGEAGGHTIKQRC